MPITVQARTKGGTTTALPDFNTGALLLAKEFERSAYFKYAKGDGTVIEARSVQPEELIRSRDGSISVIGFDPDRNDIRAFRLDRIVGSVTL
jgi:predicted DNA-binding transcriptional regulator YafY